MKTYKLEVDENAGTYLQRLTYEYDVMKDNLTYIITHYRDDASIIESKLFKEYEKKEMKAKFALETGQAEFEKNYIPQKLRKHRYDWHLDFRTMILTVTLLCDCEVEFDD